MRDYQQPGRSPAIASNGMVATSHPLAASEALTVLRDGGNAVDAAIAGAILLGACEPQMTGIGGDCFALVKPAGTDDVVAINGSGRAPAGLSADALRNEGLTAITPGHPASITVPGAIDAFCQLSDRFGRVGLERCLTPAIRYFDEGVPIAPRVAFDIGPVDDYLKGHARNYYMNAGRAFAQGDKFSCPAQADALRLIAREGRAAFYEGEIAHDMLAALEHIGASHTAEDIAATKATWGTPVSGDYRTVELLEHPPNGQGATAILLSRILSEFDLTSMDPSGAERFHLEAEASKLAYDARNRFLADPDHVRRLEHMLSDDTARSLAALIDPKTVMQAPAPLSESVHKDTVLITTVDRDGMAVSMIYSIFARFGAGVASPKFGVLFHNRGSGFNLIPGHPNEAGPGKRPMHTIIPAMTRDNSRIDMTFGVMGGQYQATGHAHFLSNLHDFGMDVQEAIDAPRAFADPITGKLQVENSIPTNTVGALKDLGHDIVVPRRPIGGAQAIQIDHERGVLIGGSDPRKDGIALGY
ncbi:MAG: gamma-glutamyltransferase family protein [Boseongicola sp.]